MGTDVVTVAPPPSNMLLAELQESNNKSLSLASHNSKPAPVLGNPRQLLSAMHTRSLLSCLVSTGPLIGQFAFSSCFYLPCFQHFLSIWYITSLLNSPLPSSVAVHFAGHKSARQCAECRYALHRADGPLSWSSLVIPL